MMIAFILLLSSIAFQISAEITTGYENVDYATADKRYNVGVKSSKRYLDVWPKNEPPSALEWRSYVVPSSLLSTYGHGSGRMAVFTNAFDAVAKRYSGTSLGRGRDAETNSRRQRKRTAATAAGDDVAQTTVDGEQPDATVMKEEIISTLRPVIVDYLKEFNKKYDPRKVDLFLRNLANAIYDRNEEVSMEGIRGLAQLDYFQPEHDVDVPPSNDFHKRNIQSLVRELNVSYSGNTAAETQHRETRRPRLLPPPPHYDRYVTANTYVASLPTNVRSGRYAGTTVDDGNALTGHAATKRTIDENAAETVGAYRYEEEGEVDPFGSMGKRHTMYDINEPDITFEYPSQVDQVDYPSDYAEQDAAIPIGKRYLGPPRHGGRIFVGRIPGHQRRREHNCIRDKRRVC